MLNAINVKLLLPNVISVRQNLLNLRVAERLVEGETFIITVLINNLRTVETSCVEKLFTFALYLSLRIVYIIIRTISCSKGLEFCGQNRKSITLQCSPLQFPLHSPACSLPLPLSLPTKTSAIDCAILICWYWWKVDFYCFSSFYRFHFACVLLIALKPLRIEWISVFAKVLEIFRKNIKRVVKKFTPEMKFIKLLFSQLRFEYSMALFCSNIISRLEKFSLHYVLQGKINKYMNKRTSLVTRLTLIDQSINKIKNNNHNQMKWFKKEIIKYLTALFLESFTDIGTKWRYGLPGCSCVFQSKFIVIKLVKN